MIEVKGLKLSSSFYFADYDKFKSSFLEKKQSLPKSKNISGFNKFPFFKIFFGFPE